MTIDAQTFPKRPPLQRLVSLLDKAFHGLCKDVDRSSLERLATVVYQAMTTRNRAYHRIGHILAVETQEFSAHETIAYVFHDLVYWQIDHAKHPTLRELTKPYQIAEEGEHKGSIEFGAIQVDTIAPQTLPDGFLTRMIFGLRDSTRITFRTGMNEFLSAHITERLLRLVASNWDLIQILACIEMTIPFRKEDTHGRSPVVRLRDRIRALNAYLSLDRTDAEIDAAVLSALKVSHFDLRDFALKNSDVFLKNTWDLMWEVHPSLQMESYFVKDYREALLKYEGFFASLDPLNVFDAINGNPNHDELTELRWRAKRNIRIGLEYTQAKLVSIALVEAVAHLTGGDAPLMLFMGNDPERRDKPQAEWESLLLSLPTIKGGTQGSVLVQVFLEAGREGGTTKFDISKSPIAAFIYSQLPYPTFKLALKEAHDFFEGKLAPDQFLEGHVRPFVTPVLEVIMRFATTRSKALQDLRSKIVSKNRIARK